MSPEARTWIDKLKPFDAANLKPVFNELAGHCKEASIELDDNGKLCRKPSGRRTMNMLGVSNAIQALGGLPAPEETWHCVCRGNFAMFDLIPTVLEFTKPARIEWLGVSTLGFSKANVAGLCDLLDSQRVGKLDFLFSVYFRANEKDLCTGLQQELTARGQRVVALRLHAKVLAFEMSDGRCYVNESSANLRSNRNVEQFTLTNSRPLLEFTRQWMAALLSKANARGHR
jgi:hypothetical protein